MKLHCIRCGKACSPELPSSIIFRAVAICPECLEKPSALEIFKQDLTNAADAAVQMKSPSLRGILYALDLLEEHIQKSRDAGI